MYRIFFYTGAGILPAFLLTMFTKRTRMPLSFLTFLMRTFRFLPILLSAAILLPATAFALEGIGPRVTVTGTVVEVHMTDKQKFDQIGGELIIKATNGQIVTATIQETARIISEGRLSRKSLITANIQPGMLVRVVGWRIDSKTLSASMIIIQNIELNPILSLNGILQSISGNSISVLTSDGKTRIFTITNETTVSISYELTGPEALSLLNKQVLLTMNPNNNSNIRILRVTGNKGVILQK